MTHLAVWPLTPAASWAVRRFPAQITWINEFPLCSLQDQSNQYGPQISYHGDQSDRWRGSRWRTGGGEEGYRHLALIPPLLLLLKLRRSVWSTINQRISECDVLSCSPWGVTYEQFEALQITDCRDCGSVLRCAHRWWRSSSSSQWIRPSRGDNRLVVSDINSGEKWVSGSQVRVQKSVWACARNRFT